MKRPNLSLLLSALILAVPGCFCPMAYHYDAHAHHGCGGDRCGGDRCGHDRGGHDGCAKSQQVCANCGQALTGGVIGVGSGVRVGPQVVDDTGPDKFGRGCHSHPEPAWDTTGDHTGPGLVFGTADFDGSGTVLVKVQVEDLAAITGSEGNITVWSGLGDPPTAMGVPPAGGQVVYATNGDVPLRHWTTHLDRTYVPGQPYWLYVLVDHKKADGSREQRHLRHKWIPASTPYPDSPHDMDQY